MGSQPSVGSTGRAASETCQPQGSVSILKPLALGAVRQAVALVVSHCGGEDPKLAAEAPLVLPPLHLRVVHGKDLLFMLVCA